MHRAAQLFAACMATTLAAGCGSAHAAPTSGAGGGGSCGRTYTAGHVPVILTVTRGAVPCAQAQQVESTYNHYVATGQAPGNGGGGPVHVSGWLCEGFPTPTVLRTGQVSKCSKGGDEFETQLASSTPAPSTT